MSDEVAFYRAILNSPEEADLRLRYADWLERRGDARAQLLRADVELERLSSEGQSSPTLQRQIEDAAATIDPAWLAFMTTLGRPFREGLNGRTLFDIEADDFPFTDRIGRRGPLVTFRSHFNKAQAWRPGLLDDLQVLCDLKLGDCFSGAASLPVYPFICEAPAGQTPLTASEVLAALPVRQFRSQHIETLDTTAIAYPGYHPYTDNDEIHNSFANQYIFENEEADEFGGSHGVLKSYVEGGRLWYLLLHPGREDGLASYVILLAVGRSPGGGRLLGVFTHQVCHNLCD